MKLVVTGLIMIRVEAHGVCRLSCSSEQVVVVADHVGSGFSGGSYWLWLVLIMVVLSSVVVHIGCGWC